jgi:hypothetical protein
MKFRPHPMHLKGFQSAVKNPEDGGGMKNN